MKILKSAGRWPIAMVSSKGLVEMIVRILMVLWAIGLTGCIAERDTEVVNEQGNNVGSATLSLNGFWDGEYDGTAGLRVLIYDGVVYAVDGTSGYYGTLTFNTGDRTVPTNLTAYALNPLMNTAASNRVADGAESEYFWDVLLIVPNNSLFGVYSINGTNRGNILLSREGTWSDNSPLSKLIVPGTWTATGYELAFSSISNNAVTFKGVSTTTPATGCNFEGRITNIDTNNNLYRVSLASQESCPAFNETNATGYAGFNEDDELEFYLRSSSGDSLMFMVFTPPAATTPTPTPTPTP